jgi:hypothetical protein
VQCTNVALGAISPSSAMFACACLLLEDECLFL